MRQPSSVLRVLVILLGLCFTARAYADDRAAARAHYQAGVKFYAGGDYRSAIREFSSAQQLAPADLNNYNLALCYDKLGDAEPAIQYYRAFLDKQPGSDKRAEIEGSISRLEAAAKSAATKRADEARRADDARRADEARKAEEARRADDLRREELRRDELRKEEEARTARPDDRAPLPPPAPSAGAPGPSGGPSAGLPPEADRRSGPAVAGSTGTPGSASPAPTGDSQLDRASAIDVDRIRDERRGGAGSGMPDTRGGPAVAAAPPGQPAPPSGPDGAMGPNGPNGPNRSMGPAGPDGGMSGPAPGTDEPPKKPVYKKWWFWAITGVAALVVIDIATAEPSTRSRSNGLNLAPQAGATLLRW